MAIKGTLPLDLLEAGDSAFVDAIRQVHDADALAAFAPTWFEDRRPASRRLLFEYLDRPLNAFRHEGLIKRLFKRAEAEGDDPLMARFLVLFDRSIRRALKPRQVWVREQPEPGALPSKGQKKSVPEEIAHESRPPVSGSFWESLNRFWTKLLLDPLGLFPAGRFREAEVIAMPPGTTMPRNRMVPNWRGVEPAPDWAVRLRLDWSGELGRADVGDLPEVRERLRSFTLFSVDTRNHLRRRTWRYFRKLGVDQPGRYVAAAAEALALYREDDTADGLALIDNWGLVHILFHHSPALEARPHGWKPRAGQTPGELAPAPIYDDLWALAPGAVVGLLSRARSTTVRRWAVRRVEADLALHRPTLATDGWLDLLEHDDPEVVALAARVLDESGGLETLGVDRWLRMVEAAEPSASEGLCGMMARLVGAGQVTIEQAARLAGLAPLPVARLGLSWLREKASAIGPGDLGPLLALIDARCERLRPEILEWLRGVFASASASTPGSEAAMVAKLLDSPQADARREGRAWLRADPRAVDEVETWRPLVESPRGDIRLAMVAGMEDRAAGETDLEPLRRVWAGVLLDVDRGSRARPAVVRQILGRLEARPDEAADLVPLLGLALRSVRAPERRMGLVALVRLVEARAELEPLVRSSFPELQLG